ncbi:signal transduction histidine kinase [Longilinea arvoryzae]|uniref:Signal transduction histidine kinase n=1 Tax=Longilinea arvoryzae TaxID=360412 RepID=A0A0S7BCB6_9CHLR|nr:GAF domain-containing sensor histidine kinase [Longilinea arvoryzae]GAP12324.1 signal transduction histidine kinase [Longilinea arvoryzae]
MRKSDFPFLADWLTISLRWLSLLLMTAVLSPLLHLGYALVLAFSAAGNVFSVVLAASNRRMEGHRLLNVGFDVLVALVLFILGGLTPLFWCGLIAITSAAIYYEWRGSLLTAALLGLAQAAWLVLVQAQPPIAALPAVGFDLVSGLLLGWMSTYVMTAVRRNYRQHLNQRSDLEQNTRQREHDRMRGLYKLIESLSASLNYQDVLDAALDLGTSAIEPVQAGQSSQITSAVLLFNEESLIVGTARRFSATDLHQNFPAEQGVLARVLQEGAAVRIANPSADPELAKILALQGMTSAVVLPLMRGMNAYGVLLYAHPQADFFTTERLELLDMISTQSVIAIQNARLYDAVRVEKERIVESQEEARKKLARDLHDGPTQSVASIAMRLSVARRMLQVKPDQVNEELERIEELARRTTQEIRHMLFTMRPLVLESDGLAAALQAMADKMRDTYQQNIEIQTDPAVIDRLDNSRQTAIFYLSEEAVNNARKHAKASRILVRVNSLRNDPEVALLEIADNGVGFDPKAVGTNYERRGSLGMVNLRERTELVEGLLNIDSAPGCGTRVQVFIPLSAQAADRLQRGLVNVPAN